MLGLEHSSDSGQGGGRGRRWHGKGQLRSGGLAGCVIFPPRDWEASSGFEQSMTASGHSGKMILSSERPLRSRPQCKAGCPRFTHSLCSPAGPGPVAITIVWCRNGGLGKRFRRKCRSQVTYPRSHRLKMETLYSDPSGLM